MDGEKENEWMVQGNDLHSKGMDLYILDCAFKKCCKKYKKGKRCKHCPAKKK